MTDPETMLRYHAAHHDSAEVRRICSDMLYAMQPVAPPPAKVCALCWAVAGMCAAALLMIGVWG